MFFYRQHRVYPPSNLRMTTQSQSRSSSSGKGFSIRAAGKILSKTNAETIKTGLIEIHKGVRSISQVLAKAGVTETDFLEEAETEEAEEVEASALTDTVARQTWRNRFRNTLDGFWMSYLNLHSTALADLKNIETEADRQQAIDEEIQELQQILKQLLQDRPPSTSYSPYYDPMELAAAIEAAGLSERVALRSWIDALSISLNAFQDQFLWTCTLELEHLKNLSSEDERTAYALELITDLAEILKQHSQEMPPSFRMTAASDIYAAAQVSQPVAPEPEPLEYQLNLAGAVVVEESVDPATTTVGEIQAGGNLHPIVGTLFEIDKPSDTAPSVGPGLPLYIPRSVAEQVLSQVRNKPLEAADTFTQHDKDKTIGVMESAEIDGDEFVFHGYLWDYNHPEKVEAITTAKKLLGSSMNARAKGHITTTQGTKVYWIDELELLGGCILFNDLATYRNTRINAGSHRIAVVDNRQAIAASQAVDCPPTNPGSTDHPSLGALNSMDPILQQALNSLGDKIDNMQKGFSHQISQVEGVVADVSSKVAVLEQDRESQIQARSQREQEQQKQSQQTQLLEAIGGAISTKLQEFQETLPAMVQQEVSRATNTRQVPVRPGQTVSLLTQASGAAPAANEVVAELERVEFALDRMRAAGGDPAPRLLLAEQARQLRAQLTA